MYLTQMGYESVELVHMVPHWEYQFSKWVNKLFFFKFDVGVPFGRITFITFNTSRLTSSCPTLTWNGRNVS